MKLSFKTVSDFARSERGKQLVQRARALDTPENRKKATQAVARLRGSKGRPPA